MAASMLLCKGCTEGKRTVVRGACHMSSWQNAATSCWRQKWREGEMHKFYGGVF
jgi:hypothetical protein